MITIRKASERGQTQLGWLNSYHSFSFGNYYDPKNVHFRHLRVINDDYIAPKGGFGTHPHNDMEIITIVSSGKLEHKDSLGNGSVIRPGEIQKMSAGTGILHSEFNPSDTEDTHLYQIWLFPERKGITPSYDQIQYDKSKAKNDFLLLASPDKKPDVIHINQDAHLYLSELDKDSELAYTVADSRNVWVQVVKGDLELNNQPLTTGDGVAVTGESSLQFKGLTDSEILLFDLN